MTLACQQALNTHRLSRSPPLHRTERSEGEADDPQVVGHRCSALILALAPQHAKFPIPSRAFALPPPLRVNSVSGP